jgi:hypothetical protein
MKYGIALLLIGALTACSSESYYEQPHLSLWQYLLAGMLGSHGQMINGCTPPCGKKD